MAIELLAVTFRSRDPQRDAEFWGAVLGRPTTTGGGGFVLAGGAGQVGLRFAEGTGHGQGPDYLHLHLSESERSQKDTIAICLSLGARLRGSGHIPENGIAYLSDVAGDDFCVIEDGTSYLSGCGPLGEVTCDGTHAVGVFWSAALGWPLVWDEGEETAIQSPAGGTKPAWSGDPVDPAITWDRQYFVLTVPSEERDDELNRLIALGASMRVSARSNETTLADPDGTEFVVQTSAGSAISPD